MKQFSKISLCSLFLFFLSCKDQEMTKLHQDSFIKPETNSSFEFSIDDYKKIPIVIQKNARIAKDDSYTKKNKKIKSSFEIKDNNEIFFNVVNFEGGGYLVFSADKRSEPIFAFSETGVFSENAVTLKGIKDFITMAKEKVKLAKTMKNIPPKEKALWERFEGKIPLKKSSKTSFWCDYEYYSNNTGSYVSNVAQWHQGSLAAFYMDTEVSCGNCDRKEAGCGNISMGQIMRFYQHPQGTLCYNGDCLTLNYNSMPQYSTALVCGSTPPDELRQISILMRNLFITNNSGYIGCQTFTYPWNIPAAFSNYGYSNGGIKENYNDVVFSKVKPDLKNYHPVIFSGTLNPFNMNDAHIWVGDGWFDYYSVYPDGYYDEDGNFIFTNCNYYYGDMISLNWGFNLGNGNGFYNIFYFNSPLGLYDTYLKVITGIRP